MSFEYSDLLEQFEALTLDPAEFGHREHVQVAFEMLHKYSYLDACTKYANTINTIATNAGAADKFNVTITFAFLSLIAARMNESKQPDFAAFVAENPDLLSSEALERWYSRDELASDFARTHFLLPTRLKAPLDYRVQLCRQTT